MDEEKEKQLAKMLGDYLDGADVDTGEDEELLLAAETARVIEGVAGTGPQLKPEFDDTLRARLVREAAKNARPKAHPALPPAPLAARRWRWVRTAVAAAFFVFIVPTLWMMREQTDRNIADQLEKYDKMYVPYTERVKSGSESSYRKAPFSDDYNSKVRLMQLKSSRAEPGSYYMDYRRERRFPR